MHRVCLPFSAFHCIHSTAIFVFEITELLCNYISFVSYSFDFPFSISDLSVSHLYDFF